LKQIGLNFIVRPSGIKETLISGESPAKNVRRIALAKARDVAKRFPKGIVVGADTIVVLRNRILGKPRGREGAERMLRSLSGKSHDVFTGFAIVDAGSGAFVSRAVRTRVWFRRLSNEEISGYVASGSPLDKAGAYGIQDDFGAVFVERISGCFYNVVGFPLARFHRALQEFTTNLE